MTLRYVLRSLALSTLGLATTVAAQNRLEPQGKPPQAAPAPSIAEAIEQLQAKDWIRGLLSLQDLARDQQQEVLEAVAPLAHPDRDPDTIGRARAAILLLAAAHERRERDELQKQFRKANDAADDLQRAIGDSPSEAEKKALASLQAHLAALKKQVDAEGPLAPTPLRVPVNRAGRGPKPPAPASGSGRSDPADGYEKVEVDGKTFLVPKNNLPANGEYEEAEMTEQGLVIKPKKKGEAKPDPKPPATKPAAGTGDKQP